MNPSHDTSMYCVRIHSRSVSSTRFTRLSPIIFSSHPLPSRRYLLLKRSLTQKNNSCSREGKERVRECIIHTFGFEPGRARPCLCFLFRTSNWSSYKTRRRSDKFLRFRRGTRKRIKIGISSLSQLYTAAEENWSK